MSVSTISQYQQLVTNSGNLRERQIDLQQQVSTGYRARVFSGLGTDAVRSISLRDTLAEIGTFRQNIVEVGTRTSVMDTAMVRVTEIARNVETELLRADGVDRGDPVVMRSIARQALQDIGQLLNTQVDGRYVFGGSATDTPPVNAGNGLANAADTTFAANFPATPNQITQDLYAAVYQPSQAFTPPNGANAQGLFNSQLAGGDFAVSSRVDRNYDVSYGIKADAEPFRRIIYGLSIAAGLTQPTTPAGDAVYRDLARTARTALSQGAGELDQQIGILGSLRSRVDTLDEKHEAVETLLRASLGEVEDADIASAATQLQLIETQLQATFSVIANQRRFSLVDFLT